MPIIATLQPGLLSFEQYLVLKCLALEPCVLRQAKPGLRRVRSWAGEVRADDASACHDQRAARARHLQHLSASSASLPPLAVLPPPISMGVPPPANIDLDVNFEAEIKPHLHACLVRSCYQQSAVSLAARGNIFSTELILLPVYLNNIC